MTVPTHGPERGAGPVADPACLTPHPFALLHFPLGPDTDDAELVESIGQVGVQRPLTVTGDRCASPPGTVLNGNRRRRASTAAGVTDVPVRVLEDLTATNEERIILSENLGDQLGRRLSESRRAALEHELLQRLGKGQGHRSDLTSAGAGGSGDTREKVAAAVGSSRHAVDDRRVIFYSPISCTVLKEAVDAGKVSRTHAAEIVREAEKKPAVAAALRSTTDGIHQRGEIIANASAWVEQQVRLLDRGKAGRAKPKLSSPTPAKKVDVDLKSCPTEVSVGGRRLRVASQDERLILEDLGPAPPDDQAHGPFLWPEEPYFAKVTMTNWIHAVHRAVARFPDDLRSDIAVGNAVVLPPENCPSCGGTMFSRSARRCMTCDPPARYEPTLNLRSSRTQVLVTVRGTHATAELPITHWTCCLEAGLHWEESSHPTILVGRNADIVLGGKREPFTKSLQHVCDVTLNALVEIMRSTHGVRVVDGRNGFAFVPQRFFRSDGSRIVWRNLDGWMSFAET